MSIDINCPLDTESHQDRFSAVYIMNIAWKRRQLSSLAADRIFAEHRRRFKAVSRMGVDADREADCQTNQCCHNRKPNHAASPDRRRRFLEILDFMLRNLFHRLE